MIETKSNKGITLITAIIAIIVMLILVGVGTNAGINMYREARKEEFINQMQLIQAKVDELVNSKETALLGQQVNSQNKTTLLEAYNNDEIQNNTDEYFNSFKLFSETNLKDQLELENIEEPILINFSTREVVSTKGLKYKNKTYYTQYLLKDGQKVITHQNSTPQLDWDISKEIDGLNCLIKISNVYPNATLSYGESESGQVNTWNTLSSYTKANEEYSINISKSGEYVFKVTNNETNSSENETIDVTITNKPKTNKVIESYDYAESDSTKWAYVTAIDENENEELYVWVPRFAVNNTSNATKFIKGNSNIAEDNTYIEIGSEQNNWTIPNVFSSNNEELTGIWIQVSTDENLTLTGLINMQNMVTLNEITE